MVRERNPDTPIREATEVIHCPRMPHRCLTLCLYLLLARCAGPTTIFNLLRMQLSASKELSALKPGSNVILLQSDFCAVLAVVVKCRRSCFGLVSGDSLFQYQIGLAKILKIFGKTCFHKIMQRLPQERSLDFTIRGPKSSCRRMKPSLSADQ